MVEMCHAYSQHNKNKKGATFRVDCVFNYMDLKPGSSVSTQNTSMQTDSNSDAARQPFRTNHTHFSEETHSFGTHLAYTKELIRSWKTPLKSIHSLWKLHSFVVCIHNIVVNIVSFSFVLEEFAKRKYQSGNRFLYNHIIIIINII